MRKLILFSLLIANCAFGSYGASFGGGSAGLIEEISGFIPTPGNNTYVVDDYAMYAYTINAIAVDTTTGTVTLALNIGGTPVTSCSAISVSSVQGLTSCTAANAVTIGSKVTLVLSSNSSSANLGYTIKTTRN